MKNTSRTIKKDVTVKSLEGNSHDFEEGDEIIVKVIDRREGICQLVAGAETYKCKAIKGISKPS